MPVVQCPCGQTLRTRIEDAGQKVGCRSCRTALLRPPIPPAGGVALLPATPPPLPIIRLGRPRVERGGPGSVRRGLRQVGATCAATFSHAVMLGRYVLARLRR